MKITKLKILSIFKTNIIVFSFLTISRMQISNIKSKLIIKQIIDFDTHFIKKNTQAMF